VEESFQNKSQLCGNYQIIPAASVMDESMKLMQSNNINNQGVIYNDNNNFNINPNEVNKLLRSKVYFYLYYLISL